MRELARLHQVSKVYPGEAAPVTALRKVSLSVHAGDFIALVGPSGCGKSTLLHVLGGMDRPTEGEVWLGDVAMHSLSEEDLTQLRREAVGFVFQFFHLLPTLTVEENVDLPLLLSGRHREKDRVHSMLASVGLEHRLQSFPGQLSGGEMQRVAIARALIQDPMVVLADEPTGNLDSDNGRTVLELLHQVCLQGRAVVMATHSVEAAAFANRQAEMRDGSIKT